MDDMVQAVKHAADWFVNRSDYVVLRRDLLAAMRHPQLIFRDEVWPMNTLLGVGRERGQQALLTLIKAADAVVGYDEARVTATPPVSFVVDDTPSPDAARMSERRRRWKQAVRIYRRLTGRKFETTRDEEVFAREHFQPLWMSWKHEMLKRAGSISRRKENELTREFWARIDRELEQAQHGNDDLARRLVGLDKPGNGE